MSAEQEARREWGEPVLTGPDRDQTSRLRIFLHCGLCPRPGRGKSPHPPCPSSLPETKVLFSPPGQKHPTLTSLAAHPPARDPGILPPTQTCSSFRGRKQKERSI